MVCSTSSGSHLPWSCSVLALLVEFSPTGGEGGRERERGKEGGKEGGREREREGEKERKS